MGVTSKGVLPFNVPMLAIRPFYFFASLGRVPESLTDNAYGRLTSVAFYRDFRIHIVLKSNPLTKDMIRQSVTSTIPIY